MTAHFLLGLLLATLGSTPQKARFDNYQVHRLLPTTQEHLDFLKKIENMPNGLTFWKSPGRTGEPVDIMVPPHLRPQFHDLVRGLNVTSYVTIPDLQSLMDKQRPWRIFGTFDWKQYQTLSAINDWLDGKVRDYPGVVSTIVGGSSYEGRTIRGVKVSYKTGNPGVFIEGGIHAREWISPATVTYILDQLLSSSDPEVRDIAENYDWYIFPSVNPDGYEYTHTTDRTWRKTRSPSSLTCYGADPNRNWDVKWNGTGSSSDPCSNTYAGASAFSEVEIRTLSEYIASISDKLHVYLSFHCSGQMLMFPYGYTKDPAPHNDLLTAITKKAAAVLEKRYGTQYVYGSISKTIYEASGSSIDWVYNNLDINITIVYELRDRGEYGYLLPPEQIIPTATETLDSVVSILKDAKVALINAKN